MNCCEVTRHNLVSHPTKLFCYSHESLTMTYFGVRQRLQDRLAAILDTEIDLSDEDMQRPAVRETYQAGRVYAF